MVIGGSVDGVGVRVGPFRDDHGPHAANLECDACDASWVGIPGDPCAYCANLREAIDNEHGTRVLRPPNDTTDTNAMTAWLARLKVAVTAGTISDNDARFAYNNAKATHDSAA